MRNETDLPPASVASLIRSELAKSLRSRNPYAVNLLLGGYDTKTDTPHLYWMDYLASLAPLPYAAMGYAQYYCLSIMDAHYRKGMDLEKGMELLKDCYEELKRRMPIDFKGLIVHVVDKDGIRVVDF